jgi:hypothetical protein
MGMSHTLNAIILYILFLILLVLGGGIAPSYRKGEGSFENLSFR